MCETRCVVDVREDYKIFYGVRGLSRVVVFDSSSFYMRRDIIMVILSKHVCYIIIFRLELATKFICT